MKADLIRMENGRKDLPVGISRGTGSNKGYRLHRTVKGKDYNFGTFQNLEHALRTNGYIDIIVEDLRKAQALEGCLSIDDIEKVVTESSASIIGELTSLIGELENNISLQIGYQFAEMHK